jgi:hypothetical protein
MATFPGKDFDPNSLKISEIYNPRYAHETLKADVKISLMLLYPISVHMEEDKSYMSTLKLKMISDSLSSSEH